MSARAEEKLHEIEALCGEFVGFAPSSLEAYLNDKVLKAACERYVERIVEGMTDLAFMVIRSGRFRVPEDDRDAFSVLAEEGVISDELCQRLRQAKGMRNILAHQYARVDDSIVFRAITTELLADTGRFVQAVRARIDKGKL